MRKILILILCLSLMLPCIPLGEAYTIGQPYHAQLEGLIQNEARRAYVQMMLDHYLRTDTMVQMALEKGKSALFLFEGCSDNMDHPDLSDISYYRVSAVCLAVRLDPTGEPYIAYFNDDSSTLPDRPLDYGAWHFEETGDVGPATVCDGTYELYSVRHGGSYEALHVRTDYSDRKIAAVYMTPDGYVKTRATEINIHTRTGNHILKNQMWSAGCILVGDGDWSQFTELIDSTYYADYDFFVLDRYVGSLTIDRQMLQEKMYDLYQSKDAVDMILSVSRQLHPGTYLTGCVQKENYVEPLKLCVRGRTFLMSLPCSNSTDARSMEVVEVRRGQELEATAVIENTAGRLWYEIVLGGETYYLYSGYAEESGWKNWITRAFY